MIEAESRKAQRINAAEAHDHAEGVVAHDLEHYTAKLPSDVWLWAAAGSMGLSLACRLKGNRDRSLFFGQWAAPFLIIGVYNKLVKIGGSDRVEHLRDATGFKKN